MPATLRTGSDDDHGGGLRDKGSNGRAFHHHHGALPSIAEGDEGGSEIWVGFFAARLAVPDAVTRSKGWTMVGHLAIVIGSKRHDAFGGRLTPSSAVAGLRS